MFAQFNELVYTYTQLSNSVEKPMITARRIDYRSVEISDGNITILCKGETFHQSHCTVENLIQYFDYFVELAQQGHEAIAII